MLSHSKTKSFIFETEIQASRDGFSSLLKSEDHGRRLYNAVLGKLLRQLRKMRASRDYEGARLLKKDDPKRRAAFDQLRIDNGLTEYASISLASRLRTGSVDFDRFVPSKVAQEIGKRAFRAVERKMFGKAKRCRFKSRGSDFSLRGSSNKESPQIKVLDDSARLVFRKKEYPIRIDLQNPYHRHALSCRIKNSLVFKRRLGGSERWFVQMTLEGEAFRDSEKERKHKASLRERFGEDIFSQNVSVDFGPKRIAVSNEKMAYERAIVSDHLDGMLRESRSLQRRMSRSIRLKNPTAFKDGSLRRGSRLLKTKNYFRLANQKRDVDRRVAAYRKCIIGHLANEIMQLGSIVKLEDISYKALQKRYGKSVGKSAPASLKASLFRTAEKLGGRAELINTFHTRLSQTCLCGEVRRKRLSERTHECTECGLRVQRDILSAFLGCFTQNSVVKKGRKEFIHSSLDLAAARSAAKGHQTLSSSGSHMAGTPSENLKGECISMNREVASSLEGSEKRRSRPRQEPLNRMARGSAASRIAENLQS
ncbi:zinc ribbon domain-containing protein [Oligoflexus tunisiensis]|uniref:zinc ribbon domain-containing protein n=1 Tax=Oligoflexus tunisiensis TaxID=708132 RepID=UPI00114CE6E4|nr:zinc ribbon domain-containing protein [Oligoflexus tunisiensis]